MQEKTKLFLNRLDHLQEKTLLTQKELLQRIGLSKGMLSFIRNEKHPPSVKVLRRLAEAESAAGIMSLAVANTKPLSKLSPKKYDAIVEDYFAHSAAREWRGVFQDIVKDLRVKAAFLNQEADRIEAKLKGRKKDDEE